MSVSPEKEENSENSCRSISPLGLLISTGNTPKNLVNHRIALPLPLSCAEKAANSLTFKSFSNCCLQK